MNILMCSVGRRGELLKNFKASMSMGGKIVATDLSPYAPALYFADKQYLVPRIDASDYIDTIICKKESINVITTFIDPEIEVLALNREKFEQIGVEVLAPYEESAKICFDKYLMYKHLKDNGISTVKTWGNIEEFEDAFNKNEINFPVFVKPRTGSGSVGARKVFSYEVLVESVKENPELIIQEFMDCEDMDADVYVDTITHDAVAVFCKKKIETRIGGASKTISFKDEKLFGFISEIVKAFKFNGPVDMDFFYKEGKYYLSEINPRFGGAYLHAYGAGVDFINMIENNVLGKVNPNSVGCYDENVVMMMYDSVVIRNVNDLA